MGVIRGLHRLLGVALGVSESEARAALAVSAAQVRASAVLLVVVLAVASLVFWLATHGVNWFPSPLQARALESETRS